MRSWRAILLCFHLLVTIAGCSDDAVTVDGELGRPIAFEHPSGLILIEATVEGLAARRFLVDTGAQYVMLDDGLVDELGLEASSDELFTLSELSFGGASFGNFWAFSYDLSVLDGLSDEPIDGIIGASLLQHFTLLIDYQNRELRILDDEDERGLGVIDARVSNEPARVDLELELGLPLVNIVAEGQTVGQAIIDSGASATSLLQTRFDELGLSVRPTMPGMESVGVNGAFSTTLTRICGLEVGEAAVDDLPVGIIPDSALGDAAIVFPELVGVVGFTFLREHLTVLDYPSRTGRLYPYAHTTHIPEDEFLRAGMNLEKGSDGVVVSFVFPDTDAEAKGLVEGDVVLTVNGDPAQQLSQSELDDILLGREGDIVTVELSHGGELEILVEELLPSCAEW